MKLFELIGVSAAVSCLLAHDAWPAGYPTKPVRMIVAFSAGGGSDLAARNVAQKLSEAFGQSVIVDNRTGANGAIGAELTARAPSDGYTLLMLSVAHVIAAAYETKLSYDMRKDFVAVSQVVQQPYLVVVNLSVPARSIQDLVTLARKKPGELNYGSTGVGGSNHLAAELFSAAAGIRMVHVPYKGPPQALADVLGGQVQLMFSSIITGLPLARNGKLRALAVTSARRSSAAPEYPTVGEALPGYESIGWYGVVAPRGTPRSVVELLSREIAKGLQSKDLKDRFAADGSETVGSTPTEFEQFIQNELARFTKVIGDAGIHKE